jgi:DNA adenine methylase
VTVISPARRGRRLVPKLPCKRQAPLRGSRCGPGRSRGPDYAHELRTDDEHRELAASLRAARAAVVLSGYDSPLYAELYGDWHPLELDGLAGNGTDSARTEVLWSNRPFPQAALSLFDNLDREAS